MRGWAIAAAMVTAAASSGSRAATPEHTGIGFDCQFQTNLNNLAPFSVWYGRTNKAGPLPHIRDGEKLFALAGLELGARMTVHVSDEWPKRFTINYFEERGKGRPSSLFIVYEHSNDGHSFLADISQFSLERDTVDPEKIVALKRYRGMCRVVLETTKAAFETGRPK